ncbi:MAG: ABC transporter substrate-binding protein, partial [Roseovarius sp.]
MFAAIADLRKLILLPLVLLAALVAAACQGPAIMGNSPSLNASKPVPVALLVPYGASDPNEQKLAKDLENAARMAASDLAGVEIDLRVYGTAGNAAKAREVALEAVGDGAKIIIGPLHAESANAAAVAVAPRGVNVLAFSNNTTVAGGNLFILGQTFGSSANRLVSFATSQGKSRILTVYANTLAGKLGRDAIQNAIALNAATPAGSVPYEFSQQAVIQAIPAIRTAAETNQADVIFLEANTAGALPLFSELLPEAGL